MDDRIKPSQASEDRSEAFSAQTVPSNREERNRLREEARRYVERIRPIPPLSLEQIRFHAREILDDVRCDENWFDFVTVLVGNEIWRDVVAAVPYERRILLLPQCLRTKELCQAGMDEVGLLCENCGRCPIGSLIQEAEDLGYSVLVSEGTHMVASLLRQGGLDAAIGASCLSALENSFPVMAFDAIPGVAVPLLIDGCDATQVDLDWLKEEIHLCAQGTYWQSMDLPSLRMDLKSCFQEDFLSTLLPSRDGMTREVAFQWLIRAGRRWRPFLAMCVFRALVRQESLPVSLRRVAVALECFHKASLIHDDIEDGDSFRYEMNTLHEEYGVPFALNVGDLLLGEGYRLIAESGLDDKHKSELLRLCALGHVRMCLGQGEEMEWEKKDAMPTLENLLRMFSRKTSTAFDVALQAGAICAKADETIRGVLKRLSEPLGVAYQIKDDLVDENRKSPKARDVLSRLLSKREAQGLFFRYRRQALDSLDPLCDIHLKILLFRLIGRMLGREGDELAEPIENP